MGAQELLFAAQLPPLGYATFYVRTKPAAEDVDAGASVASDSYVLTSSLGSVVLDSGAVAATIDSESGLMTQLAASDGSWAASLSQVGSAPG